MEVCPGSNVALGVYPNLAAHPVKMLCDKGCAVTISTDDPPFFHTTMTDEYAGLARTFGMGTAAFDRFAVTALDGAFCDDETKTAVRRKVTAKEPTT